MLIIQACKEVTPYIWRRLDTEWVHFSLDLSLSLSLSLSIFKIEIDVDAWEYERTRKYTPDIYSEFYYHNCLTL